MDVQSATRAVERRIAAIAERQYGLVTRQQLMSLGLGRGAIERRLATGRLHLVYRGVYAQLAQTVERAETLRVFDLRAVHAAIRATGSPGNGRPEVGVVAERLRSVLKLARAPSAR